MTDWCRYDIVGSAVGVVRSARKVQKRKIRAWLTKKGMTRFSLGFPPVIQPFSFTEEPRICLLGSSAPHPRFCVLPIFDQNPAKEALYCWFVSLAHLN